MQVECLDGLMVKTLCCGHKDSGSIPDQGNFLQKSGQFFLGFLHAADQATQTGSIGVDFQDLTGSRKGFYYIQQRHAESACFVLFFL